MTRPEPHSTQHLLHRAFADRAFTSRDAEAHGIPPARLHSAARAGLVERLRHGVYRIRIPGGSDAHAIPAVDMARLRAEIEHLRQRGHRPIVAGLTAAALWSIPVASEFGPVPEAPPTLIVEPSPHLHRGRRGNVLLRMSNVPDEHLTVLHGLDITSPLRTGVDLARHLARSPRTALIPLAGAARAHVRSQLVDQGSEHDVTIAARSPELRDRIRRTIDHIAARSPRRGIRLVRLMRPLVDPRLESPLESISWERFTSWPLPTATPQGDVTGASGRGYRADFLIDRVIGEADGGIKYLAGQTLWNEKQRQSDLEAAGFTVVRWTWEDMWARPETVRRRLTEALAATRTATHKRDYSP